MQPPRIYNLFPRLIGDIRGWTEHAGRARRMNFDWFYVNPFHYPGFSGSIYAVKDYYRLDPLLLPEDQRVPSEADTGAEVLQAPLRVLDDALAERPFLLGGDFSIADLNVASVLSMAGFAGFDFSSFERAKRWFDTCMARPAAGRAQGSSR